MAKQQKIKFQMTGKYHGHQIRPNKSVDISFKFKYDELTNVMKLLQLLNENVTIDVKLPMVKPQHLGMFMINDIKISGDGESTIKFNSLLDYVESNNLNNLIGDILTIRFRATIELEENLKEDE